MQASFVRAMRLPGLAIITVLNDWQTICSTVLEKLDRGDHRGKNVQWEMQQTVKVDAVK